MNMRNSIRVVIAEYDFFISEMLQGFLVDLGFSVVGAATDGNQAVRMTELLRPDAVVMDISMPELNGLDAAQQIQERCPTPVVMLAAHENPDLVRRARVSGVGAYLVKPPHPEEMERAVTIAMARFRDMMELRRLTAKLNDQNEDRFRYPPSPDEAYLPGMEDSSSPLIAAT